MDLLTALKIDLGIVTNAYDERLTQYLNAAQSNIELEGATLDMTDMKDQLLVVIYASWLWRNRDTGTGMPRMLRYMLNNRIFSEKMQGDE